LDFASRAEIKKIAAPNFIQRTYGIIGTIITTHTIGTIIIIIIDIGTITTGAIGNEGEASALRELISSPAHRRFD
jgi:hypothetical protein